MFPEKEPSKGLRSSGIGLCAKEFFLAEDSWRMWRRLEKWTKKEVRALWTRTQLCGRIVDELAMLNECKRRNKLINR